MSLRRDSGAREMTADEEIALLKQEITALKTTLSEKLARLEVLKKKGGKKKLNFWGKLSVKEEGKESEGGKEDSKECLLCLDTNLKKKR
mmetsp:Transcript_17817/g.27891  ORF Transcript_17817/g.27891 Transcript_17817/m.27891 type:complete len:89 (-) Transcript_17817:10-276(-)